LRYSFKRNICFLLIAIAICGCVSSNAISSEKNVFTQIEYLPVKNHAKYIEGNSFLKEIILHEGEWKNKKDFSPLKIGVATKVFNDEVFLFIKIEGSLYCSSHGCSHSIYKKQDGSFKLVKSIAAHELQLQNCLTRVYIITQSNHGFARFPLVVSYNQEQSVRFKNIHGPIRNR
jgi:hypothetical protein